MSNELIEKLREDGKFLGGNFGKLMHEAADSLEAKAAPVGERKVVMPRRKSVDPYAYGQGANNRAEGWNACLDEFARLNKGAGSHE